MTENVILVDFDVKDSWDYKIAIEQLTGEKWEVYKCITNKYHGCILKVIFRYVIYFLFAFKVFLKRDRYNKIIAWQQFYGLLIAFFCRLFSVKNAPEIYVMTFIYKPKNILYHKFIKYIVSSGYITKLIVLSDEEKTYYADMFNISKEMFYSTRIGVADLSEMFRVNNVDKKYYLAVGRSNRDYAFLRDAWKEEYGELIIISDSYYEEGKKGITCLKNCYGDKYLEYVAKCYAQIIPLDDENISSGSLSFLQAMMLSRPSIVTENITVHNYIKSGYNGIIIEKTPEALENAIKYINDEMNYSQLCKNAYKEYKDKFSEAALGQSIAKMLNNSIINS